MASFISNIFDSVTQYFSPRREAKVEEEPEEDHEEVAEPPKEGESSPVRNLSSELDKAADSAEKTVAGEGEQTRPKRGRPPKKQENGDEEAASPKKRRKSTTVTKEKTPKKTPAKSRKTPSKTPKAEEPEEESGDFLPKFKVGDKVEARVPTEGAIQFAWFNAVVTGVHSESKSYEVVWEGDNTSDSVHHKYVRERTPEDSGEFDQLHKGQKILGFIDPGYWFSATITELEVKNKKERIFVSWDDTSSRKKILSLDEVRPVQQH